ncbi:MAG: DEAD/DEAH box helicase family protein [bacterium]
MVTENPILNNPYLEPRLHYATNLAGELDYENIVNGRRVFSGTGQTVPVKQRQQRDLPGMDEAIAANYSEHIINILRREVKAWREAGYSNTTRVSRELLQFWFLNEERDFTQRLFFAQQEAIETGIWLNEVADKSNVGQRILSDLQAAQSCTGNLPRIAFKMATGSGKTVVMAALIVYHFYNRLEYRGDTRFADNFLIVTPGITIRDRLSVLKVDTRTGSEAADYYSIRHLVPNLWRGELRQLNHKIVIFNYHTLQPRTLQGNKRSPFDGKIGADGEKTEGKEDISLVIRRILGQFKSDSRLLIINDEAHHCYQPKSDDRSAEGEDVKTENERAAVWFSGLREISQRFKVRSIYDLSATPYYLTGSGHDPYTLFEWVVADFGLIEAIESGLVKIPFLPVSDDTQAIGMPVLRELYQHVKKDLPTAGQKKKRAQAKAEGTVFTESPPRIPDIVKAAFKQFYEHYEKEFRSRTFTARAKGTDQLELDDSPPVFIVVCNNTSVSKEVYKYIAGYEQKPATGDEPAQAIAGVYDLFSNYDPSSLQPRTRPPTLLIDSDSLENSGQIDDDFKRVFAREIDLFKRDYARLHGQGSTDQITEAEILREVVNTVGKRNMLGAHIRCVVSVSMLTEGWDANTVTHIAGLRAFGSQLLCEQVAGRALRRKSYYLQGYDKDGNLTDDKRRIATYKFPPEYAHIIGVPFKLFKGGKTAVLQQAAISRVFALRDRADQYAITFPNVEGYRIDYPDGLLTYSFDGLEDYQVDGSMLPTTTFMGTGVDGKQVKLTVDSILEKREQEIIYRIAKDLLRDHFSDEQGSPEFQRFHQLTAIVAEWYATKVRVLHKDAAWKKLLLFTEPQRLVAHVSRAIQTGAATESHIRPILHYYNPLGSSAFVHGQTTRDTYATLHSHVNLVVIDSGWEGKAAKVLDMLASEGIILSWVKNAFLDFRIPYTDKEGCSRNYYPDFIIRALAPSGEPVNLILEITGMRRDKVEKAWAVENRWLPAIHAVRSHHGWPRWAFLEIDEDIRDARNDILKKLATL